MAKTATIANQVRSGILGLLICFPAFAESPLSTDPNITPDTVYHRGGQQLPVIDRELKPFQTNPIAVHYGCIPPVSTQVSEFTTLTPLTRIHPDRLISKGGIAL